MRTLFQFLYRIRIFLLFVGLEALAFTWIHHSRSYQRSVMLHSANALTGTILERTTEINNFIQLDEQNERLARENQQLRSLTREAYLPIYNETHSKADTTYKVRYTYQEAQIVSGSYQKARNYMTLNRGKTHGVESGMGVIGSDGIVGVVNDVSRHFATVIPLINPSFSVSGRIKNSGFFGPVQWNNTDHRYAYLTDIPRYADIVEGDTVITDSRSLVFPEGLNIGYIDSYQLQDDQNFFKVKLKLATDFASTNHVYIIEDKMKDELEQLQNEANRQ